MRSRILVVVEGEGVHVYAGIVGGLERWIGLGYGGICAGVGGENHLPIEVGHDAGWVAERMLLALLTRLEKRHVVVQVFRREWLTRSRIVAHRTGEVGVHHVRVHVRNLDVL